jgi:RHS repeat-associated protein
LTTDHHFTGKERDTETGFANGNDYFGARHYTSMMGRFMSPDPGWSLQADPAYPQTWNMYSYGLNNPLINIDPTGKTCQQIRLTEPYMTITMGRDAPLLMRRIKRRPRP